MSGALDQVRSASETLLAALLSRRWEEELQTLLAARQESLDAFQRALSAGALVTPAESEELLELDRRIGEAMTRRRQELQRELRSLRAGPRAFTQYEARPAGAYYLDQAG